MMMVGPIELLIVGGVLALFILFVVLARSLVRNSSASVEDRHRKQTDGEDKTSQPGRRDSREGADKDVWGFYDRGYAAFVNDNFREADRWFDRCIRAIQDEPDYWEVKAATPDQDYIRKDCLDFAWWWSRRNDEKTALRLRFIAEFINRYGGQEDYVDYLWEGIKLVERGEIDRADEKIQLALK